MIKFSKHAELTPAEQKELDHIIKLVEEIKNAQTAVVISNIQDIEDRLRKMHRRIYWSQ